MTRSKLTEYLDISSFAAGRGVDSTVLARGGVHQPRGMGLDQRILRNQSATFSLKETHGMPPAKTAVPAQLRGKVPDGRRTLPEEFLDERMEKVKGIGRSLTANVPSLVILNDKTGKAWERPVRITRAISLDTAVRLRLLESVSAISCSATLDKVLEAGLNALGVPGALDVDIELARVLTGARDSEDV